MIKLAVAKKRVSRAVVATLALAFALVPAVSADSFPYMKVFGGDTWAGGWFTSSGACTPTAPANYQNPANYNNNGNVGAILTYANAAGGGSSDEFGALSFGDMDNSSSGGTPGGFYSNGHSGAKSTSLSFASPGINGEAGAFEGNNPPQANCIPDYYSKLKPGSPGWTGNYNPAGATQYQLNGSTTLAGATINAGTNMTLFVNGNVFISGPITYATNYNETNVPKFALVVKGNIFIQPGVTQLDGVYVAEPSSGANDGIIWTCHDNGTSTTVEGTWARANCGTKLTVNGSLIAKQVNFLRINGDLSSGSATAGEASTSGNIAETVNYTPSMVIGGPFFQPTPSTSNLDVQDLISLPPLF